MPDILPEKDFNSPYYLLGFDQDDIDYSTEDADSLDESTLVENPDMEEEDEQEQDKAYTGALDLLMRKFNLPEVIEREQQHESNKSKEAHADTTTTPSFLLPTTTIQREKQTSHIITESRSKELTLSNELQQSKLSFSCDIVCGQHVSYTVLSSMKYKPFDLDKLDVVLNEVSVLEIQVACTLNGLDVLEYPSWMTEALTKVMQKADFTNITRVPTSSVQKQQQQKDKNNPCFQFGVQRAFVTTPLSYLLEKQAQHGVLETLNLHLDWCVNSNCHEFQLAWKHGFKRESIVKYVEEALFETMVRRVFQHYPLIFSNTHVKKYAPIISQIPHISQSLHKIIKTARNTSANRTFTQRIAKKVKTIESNTLIMRPHYSEISSDDNHDNHDFDDSSSTTISFTLGMYYTVMNSIKQQKKYLPLSKVAAVGVQNPPNALEAIGKIWSITCSSAAPTLTE